MCIKLLEGLFNKNDGMVGDFVVVVGGTVVVVVVVVVVIIGKSD